MESFHFHYLRIIVEYILSELLFLTRVQSFSVLLRGLYNAGTYVNVASYLWFLFFQRLCITGASDKGQGCCGAAGAAVCGLEYRLLNYVTVVIIIIRIVRKLSVNLR